MKKFITLAAVVAILPSLAFATSPVRPVDLADIVGTLAVSKVEQTGYVVSSQNRHPFTSYLIAIPAEILTGDACTQFVGQSTIKGGVTQIQVFGSRKAGVDGCIKILPRPVHTNLSVRMEVLTGGIVAADRIQTMLVHFGTAGTYEVELDMKTDRVEITKQIKHRNPK